MQGANAKGLGTLPMTWSYWDGTNWQPFLGIVHGLTVVIEPLLNQVRVLEGQAVDGQGQQIHLAQAQAVDLSGFRDQTVLIMASYQESGPIVEAVDEVDAIAEMAAVAEVDPDTASAQEKLCLARLYVSADGSIEPSKPTATAAEPEPWSTTFNNLPMAQPITVNGLPCSVATGATQTHPRACWGDSTRH